MTRGRLFFPRRLDKGFVSGMTAELECGTWLVGGGGGVGCGCCCAVVLPCCCWSACILCRATSGSTYQRLRSYFWIIRSRVRCSSLESGSMGQRESYRPSHTYLQYSFPLFFICSISSGVNVVMVMDFTRCGGFKPRRIPLHDVQTNDPTVMFIYVGPR